jgi:DNA/RNA endonuclease YhcR with UshA esterase domain
MTQFATVMMIVWGALVVITGALMLYRGKLQGNEVDQVSLDDTFAKERAENEAIAAKINQVQPAITVLGWLVTVTTVFVVGYWLWDVISQFK